MNGIMRDQPIGRICAARSEILPACRETHATASPLTPKAIRLGPDGMATSVSLVGGPSWKADALARGPAGPDDPGMAAPVSDEARAL
jgi:hypothetical protein